MQFNLVYFPTAYGDVDPVPPPVKSADGDFNLTGNMTKTTVDSGQAEPNVWDIIRLQRELDTLKARIEILQQQIDDAGIREY